MSEPTVEEVLNLSEPKASPARRFPVFFISIAFIVFAPAAFALMYFDSTYHRYFRLWLVIIGLTSLVEGGLGLLILLGESSSSFLSTVAGGNSGWGNFLNILLTCLGAGCLVLAVIFKKENKKLIMWSAALLIIASFLALVAVTVTVFSAFSPIYNLDKTSLQGIY